MNTNKDYIKAILTYFLVVGAAVFFLFMGQNAYGVDRSTGTTVCQNPPSCITISELLQQIVARLDALEAGSGGSSPVLDYMKIVDGQLVIEGIDVRILNGNF
jgi:hypothetical protein